MDNKYIMVEEQDFNFEDITSKYIASKYTFQNKKFNYIGNNEGIEYINITNIVKKLNLVDMSSSFIYFNHISTGEKINYKIKGVKLTSNIVKYMDYMFEDIESDLLDLSEFNTQNVKTFTCMFTYAKINKLNLSNFNTKNGIDFSSMFSKAKITKVDLSSFSFENKKININYMFENFESDELVIPKSFPINFNKDVFFSSKIKVIKIQNKEFYEKHKEWFKEKFNTELILIY